MDWRLYIKKFHLTKTGLFRNVRYEELFENAVKKSDCLWFGQIYVEVN